MSQSIGDEARTEAMKFVARAFTEKQPEDSVGLVTFGKNAAVGDEKAERYHAALERFVKITSQHEISARALAALATDLNAEGDPAKAHALAERGRDAFPNTVGSAMCASRCTRL